MKPSQDVGDHIDRPTVADTLVSLGIGNACGIVVGESLQAFRFDRREFSDHIIAVGKVYLIQTGLCTLSATVSRECDRFADNGVNTLSLSALAVMTDTDGRAYKTIFLHSCQAVGFAILTHFDMLFGLFTVNVSATLGGTNRHSDRSCSAVKT